MVCRSSLSRTKFMGYVAFGFGRGALEATVGRIGLAKTQIDGSGRWAPCGANQPWISGVLVEPNVEAVAAGIEEVLGGGGPQRFAESSRSYARECSWERNAQDVLALYREVLG